MGGAAICERADNAPKNAELHHLSGSSRIYITPDFVDGSVCADVDTVICPGAFITGADEDFDSLLGSSRPGFLLQSVLEAEKVASFPPQSM